MEQVVDRFLQYVKIDTQSDTKSGSHPSSQSQLYFAKELAQELKSIGMEKVEVDSKAYVMALLPSNVGKKLPTVGFIAHMDTSPDCSGKNVNPQFVDCYDGKDIVLNKDLNIVLSPSDFPELLNCVGQKLITTDGTTLLGADDKAGLAEIVTAMAYLIEHPEIKHGDVRICFTPDEEIGEGADFFDIKAFAADFAYTMDGDELGVLEYENFNAASAKIVINGRVVHPGYAKNKMKNALLMANRLISMLPASEIPEKTEGYEGFFHVMAVNGSVDHAEMEMIIRDHSFEKFEKRKKILSGIVDQLNLEYGEGTIELELKDQYLNMLEKIKQSMYVVDLAQKAMADSGIECKVKAIRGGTDGVRLSYMGLPCPNIFAGGLNFHGRYEFVPVYSMVKAVEVIVKIVEATAQMEKLKL